LHLPRQGEVGFAGGASGDIYLEISVTPHAIFGREGDDLTAVLELPITDAALGTEVEIETLDGPKKVKIEAGAQHGDLLTLKGLGATRLRGKGRGDLRIQMKVLTPNSFDSKQKDLFKKLRDLVSDEKPRLAVRRSRSRF
jgi:molecular chaperone DnaJ